MALVMRLCACVYPRARLRYAIDELREGWGEQQIEGRLGKGEYLVAAGGGDGREEVHDRSNRSVGLGRIAAEARARTGQHLQLCGGAPRGGILRRRRFDRHHRFPQFGKSHIVQREGAAHAGTDVPRLRTRDPQALLTTARDRAGLEFPVREWLRESWSG